MAEVKALADIGAAQTDAALGDLLFIERAGIAAPITYADLMKNSYNYTGDFTLSGTMNFTAGTVTFGANQIAGNAVQIASLTARGSVEFATVAQTRGGTSEALAVTPKGVAQATLGVDHEWTDVSGSRSLGTVYQNSTGRPIMVAITLGYGSSGDVQVSSDGVTWLTLFDNAGPTEARLSVTFPVQNGSYYRANSGSGIVEWIEWR